MAEAARLSLYQDQRFKSDVEPAPGLGQLLLLGLSPELDPVVQQAAAHCSGVELARQLVAAPPNVATPQHLADTAAALATGFGLELKVLDRRACQAALYTPLTLPPTLPVEHAAVICFHK